MTLELVVIIIIIILLIYSLETLLILAVIILPRSLHVQQEIARNIAHRAHDDEKGRPMIG